MVPKKMFFTKGVGRHKQQLQSFELALRNAGIEKCNIVNVSSIVPPHCKIIPRKKGIQELKAGQITFDVMARNCTNEPNRFVGAAIGVVFPKESNSNGYISEHHCFGVIRKKLEDYTEDLAATILATTLGLEFDPNKAWDQRKQQYKMSGRTVRTQSIAQTAEGDKNGLWTTVIAVAIFNEK
jgi:arginine decarboxylase